MRAILAREELLQNGARPLMRPVLGPAERSGMMSAGMVDPMQVLTGSCISGWRFEQQSYGEAGCENFLGTAKVRRDGGAALNHA